MYNYRLACSSHQLQHYIGRFMSAQLTNARFLSPSLSSLPPSLSPSLSAAPVSRKTTAIYEKAWFIAIACVVCVVVVLALFLAFVGRARLVRKRRQKYSGE